jgi:hypothetical protein
MGWRSIARGKTVMNATPALVQNYLLFFILPLWIAAGFVDYLSHRRTDISHTSGAKEAFLHLLMVVEVGIPLLMALIFEINALVLAVMLVALVVHEATGVWDLVYAHRSEREVRPIEQHAHSFLEVLPLMAVSFVVFLHWADFLGLLGLGSGRRDFSLEFKADYWGAWYAVALLGAAFLFAVLPFAEELWRCLRQRDRARAEQEPPVTVARAAPDSPE